MTRLVSPGNQPKPHATHVTVTDMPFISMVSFMIKWAHATIPAFFILALSGAFFWGMFTAIFLR
jgi:hypothetical protein